MDQQTKLEIFKAQTENVRAIDHARSQIQKTINLALRKDDTSLAEVQTKVLALLFCTWVEANFSKVIHTPYGFNIDEICQIKDVYRSKGLGMGWQKCIEIGLLRVMNNSKSNYIPNIRLKLLEIVEEYVINPSLLRNKIAHGQWDTALNRENTTINNELTVQIRDLDIVQVDIWYGVHKHLSAIIESLIESPQRTFHRDYWIEIAKLQQFLAKTKNWSIKDRIDLLKRKPIRGCKNIRV